MMKRLFFLKNLLFLAGLAFLTSKILQTLILSQVAGDVPVPRHTQRVEGAEPSAAVPLHAYEPIAGKNIFNSESGEAGPSAPEPAEKEEPMEPSELNVLLLGTTVGPPEDTFAVIQNMENREQDLYQVGDTVQDEARIVKVSRCRVVLNRDGSREVLECIEPDERPSRISRRTLRPGPGRKDTGIRKVSKNRYRIDEERVESALTNVNRLMTQIRVVPSLRGGENRGWKVFAIRPNSIFSQVGLRNGDIIQSVNGRDLRSPSKAFEAFRELRDTEHLEVEIMRRGRPESLHYEIR